MNPFYYVLIILVLLWSCIFCLGTGNMIAAGLGFAALIGWIRAAEIESNISERFEP